MPERMAPAGPAPGPPGPRTAGARAAGGCLDTDGRSSSVSSGSSSTRARKPRATAGALGSSAPSSSRAGPRSGDPAGRHHAGPRPRREPTSARVGWVYGFATGSSDGFAGGSWDGLSSEAGGVGASAGAGSVAGSSIARGSALRSWPCSRTSTTPSTSGAKVESDAWAGAARHAVASRTRPYRHDRRRPERRWVTCTPSASPYLLRFHALFEHRGEGPCPPETGAGLGGGCPVLREPEALDVARQHLDLRPAHSEPHVHDGATVRLAQGRDLVDAALHLLGVDVTRLEEALDDAVADLGGVDLDLLRAEAALGHAGVGREHHGGHVVGDQPGLA